MTGDNVAERSASTLWFFIAATMILLAPLWLVGVVPTQDGPIHLAQADMIARFGWNGALAEPFATFYEWNPRIEPNYSVYALLAGLIWITGNAFAAQTVYLTLFGLAYAAAALWAVRQETDRPLLPFLLLLPLGFGMFTHLGFFNYVLGFPAFLVFACLWRRLDGRRSFKTFLILALLLLTLALTHLSTLVAACLLMGASGLSRALASLGTTDRKAVAMRLGADALWSLAAALPALALAIGFLAAYPTVTVDAASQGYYLRPIIRRLITFEYFFSFTWWEVLALAPAIAAMIVAVLAALWRWRRQIFARQDLTWPLFVVLIVLVSLLDLKTAQSVTLAERLAAYSWIGAALALASRQPDHRFAQVLAAAAAVALIAQSGLRALAYTGWSATSQSIIAGGRTHPGQTFTGLNLVERLSRNFSWRVQPAVHIHHLAAIAGGGVGMGSSLPSTRYYGYYPLRYVPAQDMLFAVPLWEEKPEIVSLSAFRKSHGGAPKVLFLIGDADQNNQPLAGLHGYDSCTPANDSLRSVLVCAQK